MRGPSWHRIKVSTYLHIKHGRKWNILVGEVGINTAGPVPRCISQHMVALVVHRQSGWGIDKNITIFVTLEVGTYDRAEILTYLGSHLYVKPCSLFQFKHIHVVHQFLHLITILREVEIQIPREVFRLNRTSVQSYFHTFILNFTRINQTIAVAGSRGAGHTHNLILAKLAVISEVQADTVLQEFQFQTHFEWIGLGRFQILIGDSTVTDITNSITGISKLRLGIHQSELICIGITTNLRPWHTHFTIRKFVTQLQQLGEYKATGERRIDIHVITDG